MTEPTITSQTEPASQQLPQTVAHLRAAYAQVRKVIVGQDAVVEQVLITILCGGHALLEGVPGTAKTLLVRALAHAMNCRFRRIQFTPDLMPSDILGTNTFNLKTNEFELRRGPIFTDLLLADEINRAPAKTQSALLEGMSERHATIDGQRWELSPIFTVFATQNPVEFEGTYPLPEAQQDRFLLKIRVDYPSQDAERDILLASSEGRPHDQIEQRSVEPVIDVPAVQSIRESLTQVRIEPAVLDYVLKIVRETRGNEQLQLGAGPRGSLGLLLASKARAMLHGRPFVTPDDVVAMVVPVLGHRMVLSAEAEIDGDTVAAVLGRLLDRIEVPR